MTLRSRWEFPGASSSMTRVHIRLMPDDPRNRRLRVTEAVDGPRSALERIRRRVVRCGFVLDLNHAR